MAQDQVYIGASFQASGVATGPGASGAITGASFTPSHTGWYTVDLKVGFGATAESTSYNNFKVRLNGVDYAPLLNLGAPLAANALTSHTVERIFLTAAQALSIHAVAAAAPAGAVYLASIMATPLQN